MKYLLSILLASALLLSGCGTTPLGTAYKVTGVSITAVNAAEDFWGDYVRAGLATDAQQTQVRKAVGDYNAAVDVERAAITAAYASGDTAALDKVVAITVASRSALFDLIVRLLPADKSAQLKGK